MSCLAEFATTHGRPAESVLRPYKFNKRGEGFARSRYYRQAITAIRDYHSNQNDSKVLQIALSELRARVDKATDARERSKLCNNIKAIDAYHHIYRDRHFKVLPNHRVTYQLGRIDITAQPDLWVEENGIQILLKIGVSKKKTSYVDILLTVMRKAAIANKHRIRAKNIVYLDVSSGRERICNASLSHFNSTLNAKAKEIMNAWPKIKTAPPPTNANNRRTGDS